MSCCSWVHHREKDNVDFNIHEYAIHRRGDITSNNYNDNTTETDQEQY